ncbi:hypothetical protein, partial [Streptomyces sp. NPDC093109]|uniref:hypothetical protein n=1 Tax=Streptomyces sp. NPDC093109 TaxID=3154977 RepID=UPI00344F16F3
KGLALSRLPRPGRRPDLLQEARETCHVRHTLNGIKKRKDRDIENGETGNTKKSRNVKQEARELLAGPTGKPLDNQAELEALVSRVYGQLRSRGLKSLRLKPISSPDGVKRWEIMARASAAEKVEEAQVADIDPNISKLLPPYGVKLSQKISNRWWTDQLGPAQAWDRIEVLSGFAGEAIEELGEERTAENLKGYFDPKKNGGVNRKKDAGSKGFTNYALHELNPTPVHSTRQAFYEKIGKNAEDMLREGAKASVKEGDLKRKLDALNFQTDHQFGRFSSLPVPKRELDPRLKQAAGGRVIEFLKDMARCGESGGLTLRDFKVLWDEKGVGENPHRKWLKEEFRGEAKGKHEWIPTNQMLKIVQTAIDQGSTENSVAWIVLQDKLRSFTTDVIWELRVTDNMSEVMSHDMDAHVGAFMTYDGNPIYNGRDQKWHKPLRDYFNEFIGNNKFGTPLEYLAHLREMLTAGKLMWKGGNAGDFTAEQRTLPVRAIYKSIHVKGEVTEETQREIPLTVDDLIAAQQDAYYRVLDDFLSAEAHVKKSVL